MTEEEALPVLRAKIALIKSNIWDLMKDLGRANREQLNACGYSKCATNAEAVAKCHKDACDRIEKLIQAHERAFPMRGE